MKKFIFLITGLILNSYCLFSQTYHLSSSSAPYVEITNGTPAVTGEWDDPTYSVPIGFPFTYYDHPLTNLYQLSDFSSLALINEAFNDSLAFILPYGVDLVDRGIGTGSSLSPITYKTTGTPGQRVFTLEWKNAGFYGQYNDNGSTTDFVNVQLKLYEETGDIAFHFGPSSISQPSLDFVGPGPFLGLIELLKLPEDVAIGEVLLLSGNPTNPSVVQNYNPTYLNGTPPANTRYNFSRDITAVHEPVIVTRKQYFSPNPCSDFLKINSATAEDVTSPVSVYNTNGELMLKDEQPNELDMTQFTSGIYQLLFDTNEGPVMQRIIVIH